MFSKQSIDYSIVRTSSKEALLRTALTACNNDLKQASDICEYFIKMLPNMPEREPEPPNVFDQLDGLSDKLDAWGEKHPTVTSAIGNILMNMVKNSRFGQLLQPVANVAETAVEAPPQIV